jgi:hypothetical protein
MIRGFLFLIPVLTLFAADAEDPWKKVGDVKTGTELRIFRSGAAQSILALFAELTDDNLVVIVKNVQVAVPRDKILRIDSRPQKGHVSTQTKVSGANESYSRAQSNPPGRGPSSSTSTGVAIGEKYEFETIYRRAPAPVSAKAPPVSPKK